MPKPYKKLIPSVQHPNYHPNCTKRVRTEGVVQHPNCTKRVIPYVKTLFLQNK